MRSVTSLHYYRCRECNYRGSRWGEILFAVAEEMPPLPSRPVEERDRTAVAVRRRRTAFLVLVAIGAGVLTGNLVHACQPAPADVAQ